MLTDTRLRHLKPKEKLFKVNDRDGLYVAVTPAGTISFRYNYSINGRQETVTFGRYGVGGITLAEARERLSEDDSESSLSDRIDALKKFAPRFGVPDAVLNSAVSAIEDRIGEIEDQSSPAPSPSFPSSNKREGETFDDFALRDLFTPLLDR